MRPSATSFSRVIRAISRRTGSKDATETASGVSSTMRLTPVTASRVRMLRPSRPMIRPFMSSEGSGTTETVGLGDHFGSQALDGGGQDPPGPAVGLLPCLYLEVADQDHGVATAVMLDLGQQLVLGGLGVDAGDPLEFGAGLLLEAIELC